MEQKSNNQSRKSKEFKSSQFLGIVQASEPSRILFKSSIMIEVFSSFDFVRAQYLTQESGNMLIEFRRHMILLEGKNLEQMIRAIALNQIFSIEEFKPDEEQKSGEFVYVTRIQIEKLDDLDEESASEDEV